MAALPTTTAPAINDALLRALMARGKRVRRSIVLDDEESLELIERIIRDFNDGAAASGEWYTRQTELIKNWEGIVDPKSFPYEDAANIRVPFTSVQVQQWVARIVKSLLGGELVCKFERLDEEVDQTALNDHNTWFQWELEETVHLEQMLERIVSQAVIGGCCFPIPKWSKERKELYEYREFAFDPNKPIEDQLQTTLELLFPNKDFEVKSSPGAGIYKVDVKDPDEPTPDSVRIEFSISNNRLCADVEKVETVFNGVKIDIPSKEDIVLINTKPDLKDLPFNGLRIWLPIHDYREGIMNGEWYDLGEERNEKILLQATSKTPEVVPMDITELQDTEEGTQSTDPQGTDYTRRFIEVYRWEGWIQRKKEIDQNDSQASRLLRPSIQVAVWCVPRAREIIRIERLEALNKDAERSMIKFGFIERDNRLFDIGLAEWLRHIQAELDGIHNLRTDSATLVVMPFGFYKPLAGANKDIYDLMPGKMYPTSDPSSINFPRNNANPQWSYQDEALVKKYGGEQSGLGETGAGGFVSKRQSASEYLGQANAIDLRSELIVKSFLRNLRRLLYRILGLYQQFAPSTRIYQVAGDDGLRLVKKFEMDRLNGKILLRLTGNLDQINQQLVRDVSVNMLQLLLNQVLIQLGIVKPETIYEAVKAVAKSMNYNHVPLFRPDIPEQSPPPNIENKMMFDGNVVEPHLGENYELHLMKHQQYLTDPDTPKSQKSIALVMDHIQKTQKLMQIEKFLRMQQQAQALEMSKQMQTMGIQPGLAGGQQPGDNTVAGTQDEGVEGGGAEAA